MNKEKNKNTKQYAYTICLIDIRKKTQKSIDCEFASYHVMFPERPKQMFIDFLKDWNNYDYDITIDPQGLFMDLNTAKEAVQMNLADINEAGSFPYVVIAAKTLNCMYPDIDAENMLLYKFNRDNGMYEEIQWDSDVKFKILYQKIRSGGW